MKRINHLGISALTFICLILVGCYTYPETTPVYPTLYDTDKYPSVGKLNTPGITITAEDGSFVIRSGELFDTPFVCRTDGTRIHNRSVDLISYADDIQMLTDVHKVRVSAPGLSESLYGLLLLAYTQSGGEGPATRFYQISIPQNYINEAQGGRISVVYEPYSISPAISGKQPKSWVLWLSDIPF